MNVETQAPEFLSINSLKYKWWYLPSLFNNNIYRGGIDIKEFIDRNSKACGQNTTVQKFVRI